MLLFQILNILSPTIFAIKVPKPPIDLLAPFEGTNFQTRSTNTLLKGDQPKTVSKYFVTTPKPVKTTAGQFPNAATRQPRKFHPDQTKPQSSGSALNPKREALLMQTLNLNDAETTHYERSAGENGLYHYTYRTVNGINVEERGQPKTIPSVSGGDSNDISQDVVGEYSYIAPDGTEISMNYIANENGFQPTVMYMFVVHILFRDD